MFRIRAFSEETLERLLSLLVNLGVILGTAYRKRKLLLRLGKRAVMIAKSLIIGFIGLTITLLGGVVLVVLPIAGWAFVRAAGQLVVDQYAPYAIGTSIAVLLYGFLGLLGVGTGLWIMAPQSRAGKFGKRLVVNHIFRRSSKKRMIVNSFPTSSRFGLIYKTIPRVQ